MTTLDQEERLGVPAPVPTPAPTPQTPPFRGKLMTSTRGGMCHVCGGSIQQGAAIVWRGADKKAAHHACGQDDGGLR